MKILLLLGLTLISGCAVTTVQYPGASVKKVTGPFMRSTNTDVRHQWVDKEGILHEVYLKDIVEGDTAAQAVFMNNVLDAIMTGKLVPAP